jgi:ribokinase
MTGATSRRVLVAGDLNVDLILGGDVRPRFGQVEQLLDSAELRLGSSAGIMASGLARLGVSTSLVAVVGRDTFGDFCIRQLADAGIDVSRIRSHPTAPTGLSVILSEPQDRAILTAVGAIADLTAAEVLSASAGHDHVHVASLYLLDRLAPELPRLFAELHSRGITTSVDTNWDPDERWHHLEDALPFADLFFPNVAELRGVASAIKLSAADDKQLSRLVAQRGTRVVVKDGARGGWSAAPDGSIVQVMAVPTTVVDSTGAGDSFDAGYLAAWLRDESDSRELLRWAVAAGSLSVRAAGGTSGQGTLADVLAARPT